MTTSTPYAFPLRALRRWRDEQLALHRLPEGGVGAKFLFEGSTCGNMPFNLIYVIRLAPAADQFRLLALDCAPAPRDYGHTRMCSYLEGSERIARLLRDECPLLGEPLEAAMAWRPEFSPAGCVCAAPSRAHKWLAVLHTLHFALLAGPASPSHLP
jgi:hypothetical protein